MLERSASALARAIRSGELSARAVVDGHIAQLHAVNPQLNAVVCGRYDEARREAEAADARIAEARAQGTLDSLPPLLGVPCTIKENFAFTGMPNAAGLVARRDRISTEDAPTVALLRAAGAIPLGVTNTSELCMWMESYNHVYGRTNNPYDVGRTVGGSSGGEGAIIGSGASPFGLGSDVGGSIRMPAFFNGVFGHKASPLLVANEGQFPCASGYAQRYLSTGPLCRRAEDLEPLLRVLAGTEAHRLQSVADVDLARLRVLTVTPERGPRASRDLRAARDRAIKSLVAAGARPVKLDLPLLDRALELWAALLAEGDPTNSFAEMMFGTRSPWRAATELGRVALRRSPHTLPLVMLALFERVGEIAPRRQRRLVELGLQLRAQLQDALGDDGVLIHPPYPEVAPRHYGALLPPFNFVHCAIFNVMEVPSTSVPMGLDRAGLPLGVQVIAASGNDHLGIACAEALERAHGGWVPPWRRQ